MVIGIHALMSAACPGGVPLLEACVEADNKAAYMAGHEPFIW